MSLPTNNPLLFFGRGNKKLYNNTATFSLPAGHTCPGALLCKTKANRATGKLEAGNLNRFYCYAATGESRYPATRKRVWENFDLISRKDGRLRTKGEMADLLVASLQSINFPFENVRIHVGGDFFSQDYFDAWCMAIEKFPSKLFYACTKSIPIWLNRLDVIPPNLRLTGSMGGIFDDQLENLDMKTVTVCASPEEAQEKNLPIELEDSPDSFARSASRQNFALLLHGVQRGPGTATQMNLDKKFLRKTKYEE